MTTGAELAQPGGGPPPGFGPPGGGLIKMFDRDRDGKLSKGEFPGPPDRFTNLDQNGDGYIDRNEEPKGPPPGAPGAQRGRPPRVDKGPKVGHMAPTFKLKALDGKQEFDLGGFRGKKPVVLFFGSYT